MNIDHIRRSADEMLQSVTEINDALKDLSDANDGAVNEQALPNTETLVAETLDTVQRLCDVMMALTHLTVANCVMVHGISTMMQAQVEEHETEPDYFEPLRLGLLITLLEKESIDAPVVFDFNNCAPERFTSYRGYYDQLALTWTDEQPIHVGQLLKLCRAAFDRDFVGYKGGMYRMNADTPLWASAWGMADDRAIVDVGHGYGRVVLITRMMEE